LTDLGGRIATCCSASEEGLVVILPDNNTGQEAVVALDGGGARAEDVEGIAQPGVSKDMLYLAGRIAAVCGEKKRNKRTKNQNRNRTNYYRCNVLGHYGRDCPDKPLV
jgi:hypothetical protein